MRFYFQDAGEKVSTKCVRVDSTASTEDVIKVLIEKFRPDMKSLSSSKDYAIYEVHSDAQERKLGPNERPLWIQLDWGKDGREGRFLLKNENAKTVKFDGHNDTQPGLVARDNKKRLSKREKKKQLKIEKENRAKETAKANVAQNLYKEVPDSNFTRSISNPEIVMARRRQQKLENKLKQIKYRDGGGTLKVYGETLKPDIPYKTLLMSNQDTAAFAVKETLEKYALPDEDPENYCLVQVSHLLLLFFFDNNCYIIINEMKRVKNIKLFFQTKISNLSTITTKNFIIKFFVSILILCRMLFLFCCFVVDYD
jgi:afadin